MGTTPRIGMDVQRCEANLDRAVDEVFSTMMAACCVPDADGAGSGGERVSALIGLAGRLSGAVVLQCGETAAIRMAEELTGMQLTDVDTVVRDAVGEVANMLAGTWKGFDPILCAGCMLSTPTVVTGSDYEFFSQKAPVCMERSYRFGEERFRVTIFCEDSG